MEYTIGGDIYKLLFTLIPEKKDEIEETFYKRK